MKKYTDAQGNTWGDMSALRELTGISPQTATTWRSRDIMQENVHYIKSKSLNGFRAHTFYHLQKCQQLHKERILDHKKKLSAGHYLQQGIDSEKAAKSNAKFQINFSITTEEKQHLEFLANSGRYVSTEEVRVGDIVLRSEAKPLSFSALASELFRRSLQQEIIRTKQIQNK